MSITLWLWHLELAPKGFLDSHFSRSEAQQLRARLCFAPEICHINPYYLDTKWLDCWTDSIMWGDVDVVSRCEEMVLRFSSGKMPRRLKQHIEGWWNLSRRQIWVRLEIRCILIQAQASKAPRFVFDDIDFRKDSTTRPPGPPTPHHSRCTQTFWEPIRQTFRALWLRLESLESCNETNVWKLWSPFAGLQPVKWWRAKRRICVDLGETQSTVDWTLPWRLQSVNLAYRIAEWPLIRLGKISIHHRHLMWELTTVMDIVGFSRDMLALRMRSFARPSRACQRANGQRTVCSSTKKCHSPVKSCPPLFLDDLLL